MVNCCYNAKTFCTGWCASDINWFLANCLSHIGRGRDSDFAQTVDMIKKICEFVCRSYEVF